MISSLATRPRFMRGVAVSQPPRRVVNITASSQNLVRVVASSPQSLESRSILGSTLEFRQHSPGPTRTRSRLDLESPQLEDRPPRPPRRTHSHQLGFIEHLSLAEMCTRRQSICPESQPSPTSPSATPPCHRPPWWSPAEVWTFTKRFFRTTGKSRLPSSSHPSHHLLESNPRHGVQTTLLQTQRQGSSPSSHSSTDTPTTTTRSQRPIPVKIRANLQCRLNPINSKANIARARRVLTTMTPHHVAR